MRCLEHCEFALDRVGPHGLPGDLAIPAQPDVLAESIGRETGHREILAEMTREVATGAAVCRR
jgi:hypothetical protein